jgi:Na+-translocating ferredoxin:NAD+ oxidoreductase RnfD subunit
LEIEKISAVKNNLADKKTELNFGQESFEQSSKKSNMATIGGTLLIIAGALSLITWVSILTVDISLIDTSLIAQEGFAITPEQIQSVLITCGSIGCILSIFPILGGIVTLKRKMRGLALVGGLIGLFLIGPLFASSILSLIGLIFVGLSKEEFQ